ncbi:N-acetylmuramoyl-L-alanine amidase [Clostridium sp. HBUAS56017]|uniref:peptidoglycan recognition protein family protein n=1 Tax=Clostridium sp. HBUAS56017 TaxID=2571128 RepID=UPI00163D4CBE|nr:N-acetylmuramoyl-L-alanine amidase [Clostridium sp. HBUAS56017]
MRDINKQLISINYSQGRSITPEYIVIHETDNEDAGANAMANRNYFVNHEEAEASTHFVVDDHQIVQCAELDWRCWHVGDNRGHSDITNSNSVGIEICVNADGDYNKALENAIELTKYLMSVLGLGIDRVVRHYDASGKYCPRRILDNGIWEEVKSRINNGSPVSVPVVNGGGTSNLIDRAREFVGNICSELQQLLISKGYDCGGYGADGVFGKGNLNSLLQFQKDNELASDGLVGSQTFAALQTSSQFQSGNNWVSRL